MHDKGNIIRVGTFFEWLKFINTQLGLAFCNDCSVSSDRKEKNPYYSPTVEVSSTHRIVISFLHWGTYTLRSVSMQNPKYISPSEQI